MGLNFYMRGINKKKTVVRDKLKNAMNLSVMLNKIAIDLDEI